MDGIEVGRHRTGEGRGAFFVVFPSPSPSSFPGRVSVSFLLPTSPPGPLFSFFLPFAILHARVKEYRVTRLYYTILYYTISFGFFFSAHRCLGGRKERRLERKGGKNEPPEKGAPRSVSGVTSKVGYKKKENQTLWWASWGVPGDQIGVNIYNLLDEGQIDRRSSLYVAPTGGVRFLFLPPPTRRVGRDSFETP